MKIKSIAIAALAAVSTLSACSTLSTAQRQVLQSVTEDQGAAPAVVAVADPPEVIVTQVGNTTFTATCDSLSFVTDYPDSTLIAVTADGAPPVNAQSISFPGSSYTWDHYIKSYGVFVATADGTVLEDSNTQNTITPC